MTGDWRVQAVCRDVDPMTIPMAQRGEVGHAVTVIAAADDTVLAVLEQLTTLLRDHRGLPAVASVTADRWGEVRLQVRRNRLDPEPSEVLIALLGWAGVLEGVSADVWRPDSGKIHVTVSGTLPGGLKVGAYGGFTYAPERLGGDLAVDEQTPVSLAELAASITGVRSLKAQDVVLSCSSCGHSYQPTAQDWEDGHTSCPVCGSWMMVAEVARPERSPL